MELENVKEEVRQIFTEYLNLHGHRKTPERFAILDAIYSIDGHFSMDTLYSTMADEAKFRVSRATLYNTITLLIDARLVIKHQFGTQSQYEKSFNRQTHHHLICTQCGQVREFKNKSLQQAVEGARLIRFRQTHYSLYIYGICNRCERANSKKSEEKTKTQKKKKKTYHSKDKKK